MKNDPILTVSHLEIGQKQKKKTLSLIDAVSFSVYPGEILGIVGESGCGKTLTCRAIPRLLPPGIELLGGKIEFMGETISDASFPMAPLRGKRISMIFQEPTKTLHPLKTIGAQIEEVLKIHGKMSLAERKKEVLSLLERVGIDDPVHRSRQYPFQLSGGLCQRVVLAIAVALQPDLIIADEPTTAIDVAVQKKILQLLKDLREQMGCAMILVSHDIGVIKFMCQRVHVMYCGQIVEEGRVEEVFQDPLHPYTKALMDCVPTLSMGNRKLEPIPGMVLNPKDYPPYCRFYERCTRRTEACRSGECPLIKKGERYVRCIQYQS